MIPVSVIVPIHNGARFYSSAIKTILAHEWTPIEIVIVDDGSTDDLRAHMEASVTRVVYVRQPQRGPAAARNSGIRHASAGLIAFLDVDDLWTEGHLHRLTAALTACPQAGFAQGRMQQFIERDDRQVLSGVYHMPYLGSCLFRRETLERCAGLDEAMHMGEDYDLILRCWEQDIPRAGVPEVSLLYRRHGENMTGGQNGRANLEVLLRRARRIRTGVLDPAAPRRFAFAEYVGDISNFSAGDLLEDRICASTH